MNANPFCQYPIANSITESRRNTVTANPMIVDRQERLQRLQEAGEDHDQDNEADEEDDREELLQGRRGEG